MEKRVLLHIGPYNLAEPIRKELRDACRGSVVVETQDTTPLEELDGSSFDALVAEEMPHNIDAWPRLRFIQLLSAGINHLDGHPAWTTDVIVANASGTHAVPIAQYVTCALLMMAHRMPQATSVAATKQWNREGLDCTVIRGQSVGIIGYGSIGRECARQLSALGMKVVCMKRNPDLRRDDGHIAWPGTGDPEGKIPSRWYGPDNLRDMLPHCDALVLTVPSTRESFGMIGAAELALMKKSAIVINVARGGIVNESALVAALRNGQLAGAVIDCFSTEPPPPELPLFTAPNVILTPHVAGVFTNFWPVFAVLLTENLHRFLNKQPILNRVNSKLGY